MSTLTAPQDDAVANLNAQHPIVRPMRLGPYRFKRAQSDEEFRQLHGLNYRTFVREIAQHDDTGSGHLIDKFHDKNVYYIALRRRRVVGMVTVHDQPPFSVAEKLADPRILANLGDRLIESRLLAIEPGQRHSLVFGGLNWLMLQHAFGGQYSHLLISGHAHLQPLYERVGFRPMGPSTASGQAMFVPMALSLKDPPPSLTRMVNRWKKLVRRRQEPPVCLQPGPVTLAPTVARALHRRPISHRSGRAIRQYERVRQRLSTLVGGPQVALFCGSGTLANDVVAAALAAHDTPNPGLVLVNGEFGGRLVGQCERLGLSFETVESPWGQPWDLKAVEALLDQRPQTAWIWAVHLESSTGMFNDIAALRQLAAPRGVNVCLDAVSSIGAAPLDLSGVYLASGSSGKALGSIAGIAMVFASAGALDTIQSNRMPSYFDLVASMQTRGTRFTYPSGPMAALCEALEVYTTNVQRQQRYDHYERIGQYVRGQLEQLDIEPLVRGPMACPVITTFSPPLDEATPRFVSRCRRWGYDVSGMSRYLAARRWAQIATMGQTSVATIAPLFDRLGRWIEQAGAGAKRGT